MLRAIARRAESLDPEEGSQFGVILAGKPNDQDWRQNSGSTCVPSTWIGYVP
jgi:hypothetical protein